MSNVCAQNRNHPELSEAMFHARLSLVAEKYSPNHVGIILFSDEKQLQSGASIQRGDGSNLSQVWLKGEIPLPATYSSCVIVQVRPTDAWTT